MSGLRDHKKLKADGVKIERPYNKNAETGAALAFVSVERMRR